MILINHVFTLLCLLGTSLVASRPHDGMVNNDYIRDVGVVYSESQIKGDRTFLLAVKAKPECIPLYGLVPHAV